MSNQVKSKQVRILSLDRLQVTALPQPWKRCCCASHSGVVQEHSQVQLGIAWHSLTQRRLAHISVWLAAAAAVRGLAGPGGAGAGAPQPRPQRQQLIGPGRVE